MVVSRARCRKATKKTFYCANNMNKYFTMVALALFGATAAQAADEVWTHGVNADGGWYDANKTHADDGEEDWMWNIVYPNDPTGNGAKTDDKMCYAASAANLIAWWQAQYQPVEGAPQGVENIWKTFVDNSLKDSGGTMPAAVQWWLTGNDNSSNTDLATIEGFYKTYVAGQELYDTTKDNLFISTIAATRQALVDALNEGKGVSLLGKNTRTGGGHALTLWGLEHKNGIITKMWITDSDDYTMQPELIEVAMGGTDGAYTIVLGTDTFLIEKAYTINPSISDDWGLERVQSNVPDPTTATLSLLALAGLAALRRRR